MDPDLIHRALKEPEISILQRTGGRRRFGMPSGANTDTCQIYRTFSLTRNRVAFVCALPRKSRG